MRIRPRVATTALALASTLAVAAVPTTPTTTTDGRDDTVVIAVVDSAFTPYHRDFIAALMPQHLDADPANDLPLDTSPAEWLPGFDESAFDSFSRLDLTIPGPDEVKTMDSLHSADAAEWAKLEPSSSVTVNGAWVPGTKAVAMVDFAGGGLYSGASHGVGTSSVSAGNLHGSCPECVVVFVTYGSGSQAEAASNWVMQQDWIDVVTNSFGFSALMRDRFYSGSDVDLQRTASERGQTIFFSAGNGQANTFTAPNTTLFSSQEGPDWVITVGATSPEEASYTGHGKPADVSAPGTAYPSAPSSGTSRTDSEGTFGGTSNATPVSAGFYGQALHWARTRLDGPRIQADGVVATGTPVACGAENPDCELGDGVLTAPELRDRFLQGAVHTDAGYQAVGLLGGSPTTPRITWEHEFLNEGHGTYFGKLRSEDEWREEAGRITGPMDGSLAPLERPAGEAEWFVVDSFCRQHLWGSWSQGDYLEGTTSLPGASPDWPLRSAIETGCPALTPPL